MFVPEFAAVASPVWDCAGPIGCRDPLAFPLSEAPTPPWLEWGHRNHSSRRGVWCGGRRGGRQLVEGPASWPVAQASGSVVTCQRRPWQLVLPLPLFLLFLLLSLAWVSGLSEVARLGNSPLMVMGVWRLARREVLGQVVRALTLELG